MFFIFRGFRSSNPELLYEWSDSEGHCIRQVFVSPDPRIPQQPTHAWRRETNPCTATQVHTNKYTKSCCVLSFRKWSASLGLRGLHFHQHAGHPAKNVPPLVCIVIDAFNVEKAQAAAAKEGENVLIYGHLVLCCLFCFWCIHLQYVICEFISLVHPLLAHIRISSPT